MRLLLPLLLLTACHTDRLVKCEPTGPEVCDGIDNDCDGVVDRLYQSCNSVCGGGYQTCTSGKWTECNAPQPSEEVCDGKDNDCNGLVDDALPIAPCYSRDLSELQSGQCRFGLLRCVAGIMACVGEIDPQPETCNGLDDDCNGVVDDNVPARSLDVVVVVDNSGSMAAVIGAVQQALITVAQTRTSPLIRWALVAAPATGYMGGVAGPVLVQDLGAPEPFIAGVRLQNGATGSGDEPTLDALESIYTGLVSWQADQRIVIMFSDEKPQSYAPVPVEPPEVAALGQSKSILLFTFTTLPMPEPNWSQLGAVYDIHGTQSEITTMLAAIVQLQSCAQ